VSHWGGAGRARSLWHLVPSGIRAWIYDRRENAYRRWIRIQDKYWDHHFHISTTKNLRYQSLSQSERKEIGLIGDEISDIATPYRILFAVRKKLDIQADDVVLDLGCGKGRALFVFAKSKARLVIGSDRNSLAISSAQENVKKFWGDKSKISLHEVDVRELDFSQATVLYLFHPFGISTLRTVFDQIEASLVEKPRRIRIAYYNPRFSQELEKLTWLRRLPWLKGMLYEVAFYESAMDQ